MSEFEELRRRNVFKEGAAYAIAAFVLCTMALTMPRALGHHSFAALFDSSRTVEVSGVVTEFQFRNPHCYILLDVEGDRAEQTEWELETTSPGQLIRIGLTPDNLKPGDEISAIGNPTRDGRPLMRLLTLTMPSGKEIKLQ